MPKPGLPRDARLALELLGRYVERSFLGARIEVPVLRATGREIDGFALHQNGGLSLIYIDATEAQDGGQWILQMCAVLAVEVSGVTEALLWTNDRNRRSAIDRYYCVINQDRTACAVAADTAVSSVLLGDFGNSRNVLAATMLKSLVKNTVYTAAFEPPSLLQRCDGRRLTTSEHDLLTLLAVSCW
jgi:hypothetical protein